MPNLQAILAAWPVPGPWTLRPTHVGANNLSHVIDTPATSYFLRIYQNTNDLTRIRHEHDLLLRLQHAGLSFAVPLPLTAVSGQTYVVTADRERNVVAALFPMIPGREPEGGNVAEAAACGEALGELDGALARIGVGSEQSAMRRFGVFTPVHPLVLNAPEEVARLSTSPEKGGRVRALLEGLVALAPDLYRRLPEQLIHADFDPSNALIREGRVSGVLDFEFSSPGPRAMDLAVALWGFGVSAWQTANDWAPIEALAAGYRRCVALQPVEIDALPTLLRLREATSVVHWLGRLRQGLTTERDIGRRADAMLRLDDWLCAQGEELVRRVERAAP